MKFNNRLKILSAGMIPLFLFALTSYAVKKRLFRNFDFALTVKFQDHISRHFDLPFSYFSLLGSVEITSVILLVIFLYIFFRKKKFFFGAIFFFAALFSELIGKLFIPNPAPPFFLLRYNLGFSFPSFYVHTNYSYPSGHMIRTTYLVILILFLVSTSRNSRIQKISLILILSLISLLMFISRIYLGEHWFSDVLGGLLLGSFSAFLSLAFF